MGTIISTSNSSEVDDLIEKLRLEFRSAVEDDQLNGRRLTISSIRLDSDSSNIDSKITDLENIIHKLQDEISEMCQKIDNEVHEYCITADNENNRNNKDENEKDAYIEATTQSNRDTFLKSGFDPDNYKQIFSLSIRDFFLPLSSGNKSFSAAMTELVNVGSDDSLEIPDKIREIKQDVLDLWSDLKEYAPKDNLECLINELQAEIAEKMEMLKDVDINDPCNSWQDM